MGGSRVNSMVLCPGNGVGDMQKKRIIELILV
jgi:hypothetical protein